MKKLIFAAVAMAAVCFASCGEATPSGEVTNDSIDSIAVDSVGVIDSVAVDSVVVK